MSKKITRRRMLQTSAALGATAIAGFPSRGIRAASPNEKLNIAVIGIGGRGRTNLDAVRRENIVALCDVDDERAGNAFEVLPKAQKFKDYRRMLDRVGDSIDAVVISTPDHTHFHPTYAALEMGKHVYLEKPMAHSIWEVRTLTEFAAKQKVTTQLGVQRHTIPNMHRVVELIQAGAIGDVSEVHCWVGGDRGMPDVPSKNPPVPDHLDWNLWLGPTEYRPYTPAIAPYNWRFWWDYGTGETGNWGCHILDIPYWALGLTKPTRVSGSGPEPHELTTPRAMDTWMDFPAVGTRKEVRLHWYHAATGPDILRKHKLPHDGNNTLFVGSEGMLLCGFKQRTLLPEKKFADYAAPDQTVSDSPGFHREWIDACKGNGVRPTCEFAYSGPMTETVLLGNVAYRAQAEFEWDAKSMSTGGNKAAQQYIRPTFKKGWEV